MPATDPSSGIKPTTTAPRTRPASPTNPYDSHPGAGPSPPRNFLMVAVQMLTAPINTKTSIGKITMNSLSLGLVNAGLRNRIPTPANNVARRVVTTIAQRHPVAVRAAKTSQMTTRIKVNSSTSKTNKAPNNATRAIPTNETRAVFPNGPNLGALPVSPFSTSVLIFHLLVRARLFAPDARERIPSPGAR